MLQPSRTAVLYSDVIEEFIFIFYFFPFRLPFTFFSSVSHVFFHCFFAYVFFLSIILPRFPLQFVTSSCFVCRSFFSLYSLLKRFVIILCLFLSLIFFSLPLPFSFFIISPPALLSLITPCLLLHPLYPLPPLLPLTG